MGQGVAVPSVASGKSSAGLFLVRTIRGRGSQLEVSECMSCEQPEPDRNKILLHIRSELRTIEKADCTFDSIMACVNDYAARYQNYETALNVLADRVESAKERMNCIYAVRFRMKEYNSVADKIVRRCLDWIEIERKAKGPKKRGKKVQALINKDNFFDPEEGVADLAGMRILHLKKGNWRDIHDFLEGEALRHPKTHVQDFRICWRRAYVKPKDAGLYGTLIVNRKKRIYFRKKEIDTSRPGYTSLHYVFEVLSPAWQHPTFVECQVRTVFDEGWGEISHEFDYPRAGHSIYTGHLGVLNATTSAANEVAAALEALQGLPVFIPWKTEQQLERSAEEVHCLTPSLEWVERFPEESTENYRKCHGRIYYYVMPNHPRIDERIKNLEKRLQECGLQEKVRVARIEGNQVEYPVLSDILWLHEAVDPKGSDKCEFAVVGGPPPASGREEEQLDMLIKQDEEKDKDGSDTLSRVSGFFKNLHSRCFQQKECVCSTGTTL